MKILTNLNEKICDFRGEPLRIIASPQECPKCGWKSEEENAWTIRDVLAQIIAAQELTTPAYEKQKDEKKLPDLLPAKDGLILWRIGQELYSNDDGTMFIEDHPLEVLKTSVNNFAGFRLAVKAPVLVCLEEAREAREADGNHRIPERTSITAKEQVA